MSKVLVDRELLERIARDDEGAASPADFEELKRVLTQPAEAEGAAVVGFLYKNNGQALTAADMDADTFALIARSDFDGEVEKLVRQSDHLAALSAVTAGRDRLRTEVARLRACIVADDVNFDRLSKEYKTLQTERDQLRAKVERYVPLHEAIQRAAGELPEGWEIQLCIERHGGGVDLIGPDGAEDFATNSERLDYTVIDALEAAMAAKEA